MYRCEACGEVSQPRTVRHLWPVHRIVKYGFVTRPEDGVKVMYPTAPRKEIAREYGVCADCFCRLNTGATISSIRRGSDQFIEPVVAPVPPPPLPPIPTGPVTGGTDITEVADAPRQTIKPKEKHRPTSVAGITSRARGVGVVEEGDRRLRRGS